MLRVSQKKFHFPCVQLDALNLPLRNQSVHTVLCGFGMRNLESLSTGVKAIESALSTKGVFVTLEFFKPASAIPQFFYNILAPLFVPIMGGVFSGQKTAYEYLIRSIKGFVTVAEYRDLLLKSGFKDVRIVACDGGIAHIVLATK
jgi:demethylmenaquinone methyltransferase/2-methoxy-6-polyprenyl-1,4-benzoquinol methylase